MNLNSKSQQQEINGKGGEESIQGADFEEKSTKGNEAMVDSDRGRREDAPNWWYTLLIKPGKVRDLEYLAIKVIFLKVLLLRVILETRS